MDSVLSFKKLAQEPAIDEANKIAQERMLSEAQNSMPMDMPQEHGMMPQHGGMNPFAADQYRNMNMPDAPVAFGGGIAESLLNNDEVPEQIRLNYWNVFHKDNVLTFLDEKRKDSKLLNWDIQKIDILNTIPYYEYTFEKELEFDIIRNVYETKLDRALGFKSSNVKNERIVLQSQFSEARQISEDATGANMIREGFFKRLLRRR